MLNKFVSCNQDWDDLWQLSLDNYAKPDQVNTNWFLARGTEVLFMVTSDCHPSHPTNTDGRATDNCFSLVGLLGNDVYSMDNYATHHHSLTLGFSVTIPILPKSAQSGLRLLASTCIC